MSTRRTDYAPSDQPLANFIVADAEAVLGRRITKEEASSIVKSLEFALEDAFIDAVESHAQIDSSGDRS